MLKKSRLQSRKEHHGADLQPKHHPLQQEQDLYDVFIDFKKALDRVWHAALSATMKKYNISANLIQVIKHLYDKTITVTRLQ